MAGAYGHIKATGSSSGMPTPFFDFEKMSLLMGFQDIWDSDRNHAE